MRHVALVAVLLAGLVVPARPVVAQPGPVAPYRIGVSRSSPEGDIWSTDADGGDPRRATDTADRHETDPDYSADGTLLAYTEYAGESPGRVVIANADGSGRRYLGERRGERDPSWSPDGTMLAVTRDDGIGIVRASDGALLDTIPAPAHAEAHDSQPAWSPDGGTIAFTREQRRATTPRVTPFTVGASTPDSFTTTATVRTPPVPARPEIVFLVDSTSSMAGAIDVLRGELRDVLGRIATAAPAATFGLATYEDVTDGARRFRLLANLGGRDAVQTALDGIVVGDGGDLPEDWFNALHELSRGREPVFTKPGTSRIVVLAGDASSHECDPTAPPTTTTPEPPRFGHRVAQPVGCDPYWPRSTIIGDLTSHGEGDPSRDIHVVAVPVVTSSAESLDRLGQATDITRATGGVLVGAGATPAEIVAAIEDGITDLRTTVRPVADCPAGVSVTFRPETATVGGDTDVTFTETVRFVDPGPARAALGDVRCTIRFEFDGKTPDQPYEQHLDISRRPGPTLVVNSHATPSPDRGPVPVTFTTDAADAAGAPLPVRCDATSGALFPVGLTTLTCTTTDTGGRTATARTLVTVFVPGDGDREDVWLASVDGAAVRRQTDLTGRFTEGCGRRAGAPAWSPDGGRIVYGYRDGLCVADAAGAMATEIVPHDAAYPAWSPDGALIAYTRPGGDGPDRVWSVPPSGGEPGELIRFGDDDVARPAFRRLPDLRVTGSAVPAGIAFGGRTTIALRVVNAGLAAPRAADLTLAVPAGLRVDGVTTTAGTCSGTSCALGRLAPGRAVDVRVDVTGTVAGRHVVGASLADDVNPADNRVDVPVTVADEVRPPDHPGSLSLAVALAPLEGYVGGDDLVLSYRVRNGASVPMTDVRVVTSLPPALLPVGAVTGCAADGATCALGTLAPGQEAEVRVALPARAAVDTAAGGSVLGVGPDTDAADNTAATRIVVQQPGIALDPGTGPTGFVPLATGRSFPPGATVRLGWSPGLSPTPGEVVVGPDGTFRAQVLVFHNDRVGVRRLEGVPVVGPAFGVVRSGEFLVVPRSLQPPDFASRE